MSDQFKQGDWSELKRLAEAATPGPWGCDGSYVCPVRVEGGTTYIESWRAIADSHHLEDVRYIAAANPAAILALIAENERLREVLAEKLIDSTMLTGISIGSGSLTIGAKGGVCGIMADSFGQMLLESGAENYIEAFFSSSKHPELGQIVVTVKRETGKTPHQLRKDAEAERDQLRAEVEALRAEVALRKAQREAFSQCIDSLHAEMLQKFGGQNPDDMHLVTRRDYDRDMEEIAEYRFIAEASKCDYSEVDAAMGKDAGGHSVENQAETRENTGRDAGGQGEVR